MPPNQEELLREEFYKYMAWVSASGLHGKDLYKSMADFWLSKLAHQEAVREEELVKEIETMQFKLNVDEYLPLVKSWNKLNFDVPFDHGYALAKKDIIALITNQRVNKK